MKFRSALVLPLITSAFLRLLGTYAGAFSVQTETKRISHTTKLAAETPSLLFSPPYRQSRLYVSKVEDAVRNLVTSNDIRDGKEDSSLPLKLTEFSKAEEEEEDNAAYKKSFAIISLITLFNASLSPVWHVVYQGNGPPPLFLNALVSVVAFAGLLAGAPLLDASMGQDSALAEASEDKWSKKSFRGGMELGLWKGLGTTCHIYGMALTTANHGAFLLQLTTLIVPVLQGLRGAEKIPRQIKFAIGMALTGILLFTQDPTKASEIVGDPSLMQTGDALVLSAAFFYSLYDIQTFYWGREVPRTELVTIKIGFQAFLSTILCAVAARSETVDYFAAGPEWNVFIPTVLWSGLIVNALATFLQVGGMQGVGPTRAQTIFASQPLWASVMNYALLGSVMGAQGFIGGGAFLGALFLAATAEAPSPATAMDEKDA